MSGTGSEPQDRPAAVLAGRHALVTGASRGIGRAVALRLASMGASVSLVARDRDALAACERELAARGAGVATFAADVTDRAAVAEVVAEAERMLGRPSILVNNAGAAESAPFERTDAALLARMLEINLISVFGVTRAVLPRMRAAGYGRIVNVASTAGVTGYRYVTAYCAAKHGVVGLTRALALELAASGITVNAVCPGYTDTDLIAGAVRGIAAQTGRTQEEARAELVRVNPQGRLVVPAEVAAAVGWLCLPEAAAVTGQAIVIAGGEVMP